MRGYSRPGPVSITASPVSKTIAAVRRLLSVAVLMLALWPSSALAQLVTRVVDGDTIVVADVGTVRLIGVDTPETVDPRKPVESFGRDATEFTRRMAQGNVVRLEFDVQRTDRFQRTLAYAYLADGTFLNAEIIRQGYGHAYVKYPFKYLDQFRHFEREAREAGRGLWSAVEEAGVTSTLDKHDHSANAEEGGGPALKRGETTPVVPPTAQPAAPTHPATTDRCQAITKRGTQCSRSAQAGSNYCWQHQK